MKSIFDILDDVSHQLNSPLAGAKSYTYLCKRLLEKGETKKAVEYLEKLEDKIDTITLRIDLLLTAIRLENSTVALTYELFNIAEITNQNTAGKELLADRDILVKIFKYARELTGSSVPSVAASASTIITTFPFSKRLVSDDKDITTEIIEKSILVYDLVKTHGGSVKETNEALVITLPLKPPKKKPAP